MKNNYKIKQNKLNEELQMEEVVEFKAKKRPFNPYKINPNIPSSWLKLNQCHCFHRVFSTKEIEDFIDKLNKDFLTMMRESYRVTTKCNLHKNTTQNSVEIDQDRTFFLVEKAIKKATEHALKNEPPPITSPALRAISLNILELLSSLYSIDIPTRRSTNKHSQMLIYISDWTAKILNNINQFSNDDDSGYNLTSPSSKLSVMDEEGDEEEEEMKGVYSFEDNLNEDLNRDEIFELLELKKMLLQNGLSFGMKSSEDTDGSKRKSSNEESSNENGLIVRLKPIKENILSEEKNNFKKSSKVNVKNEFEKPDLTKSNKSLKEESKEIKNKKIPKKIFEESSNKPDFKLKKSNNQILKEILPNPRNFLLEKSSKDKFEEREQKIKSKEGKIFARYSSIESLNYLNESKSSSKSLNYDLDVHDFNVVSKYSKKLGCSSTKSGKCLCDTEKMTSSVGICKRNKTRSECVKKMNEGFRFKDILRKL